MRGKLGLKGWLEHTIIVVLALYIKSGRQHRMCGYTIYFIYERGEGMQGMLCRLLFFNTRL